MLWRRLKCLNHVHQVVFGANLIMMPISEEPAFTKHPCGARSQDTSGRELPAARIPTLFGAPLETPDCESEAAATARSRSRVSRTRADLCILYFLPRPTTRSYAICGKATQLSAGKSERQLCTPSLVPPKSPAFSLTPPICLFDSLSSSLIERSRFFFRYSREPFACGFFAMAFVSFKALDVLMAHLKTKCTRF